MKLLNSCIALIFILCLMFIIGGCNKSSDSPTAPQATTGTITLNLKSVEGPIENLQTYGVAGATITTEPAISASQITSSGSLYTLSDLPVGTYTISTSKSNFSDGSVVLAVQAGRTTNSNVFIDLLNSTVTVVVSSSAFASVPNGISLYMDNVLVSTVYPGSASSQITMSVGLHTLYATGNYNGRTWGTVPTQYYINNENWTWQVGS